MGKKIFVIQSKLGYILYFPLFLPFASQAFRRAEARSHKCSFPYFHKRPLKLWAEMKLLEVPNYIPTSKTNAKCKTNAMKKKKIKTVRWPAKVCSFSNFLKNWNELSLKLHTSAGVRTLFPLPRKLSIELQGFAVWMSQNLVLRKLSVDLLRSAVLGVYSENCP